MTRTTTRTIPMTPLHLAAAAAPGEVVRVRVARRAVRTHRRRVVRLPSIGRGGHYVLRVVRSADRGVLRVARAPLAGAHRVPVAL